MLRERDAPEPWRRNAHDFGAMAVEDDRPADDVPITIELLLPDSVAHNRLKRPRLIRRRVEVPAAREPHIEHVEIIL